MNARAARPLAHCCAGRDSIRPISRSGVSSAARADWAPVKRGDDEVVALLEAQLEAAHRTIEGLRSKLGKAERIIDVQKKISSAFGIGIQDSESP